MKQVSWIACIVVDIVGLNFGGIAVAPVVRGLIRGASTYGPLTKLTAVQPRGKNFGCDNNTPPPTPLSLKQGKKIQDTSIGYNA